MYLTDPVKGSAISSHKAAKSHAARHGHARIRRQRMNEHQHERNKHEGGSQTLPIAATDSVSSASISRSGLAEDSNASSRGNGGGTGTNREIILHFPRVSQPSILETSPFTSVSKNIYSLYGTRVNSTQQFLIHHCKYISQPNSVHTDNDSFEPCCALTWLTPCSDVSVVIPFGKRHCQKYTDSKVWKRFMFTELFPVALANPGLLSAILLAACRSLFEQDKNSRYVQLATYYKLVCLRSMSELLAIQNLHVGDSTIAQASLLAADEVGFTRYTLARLMLSF